MARPRPADSLGLPDHFFRHCVRTKHFEALKEDGGGVKGPGCALGRLPRTVRSLGAAEDVTGKGFDLESAELLVGTVALGLALLKLGYQRCEEGVELG